MEPLFEFVYYGMCLIGIGFAYAAFHFMMQRKSTVSLATKHHSEIMMVLCFFMAIVIAFLVTLPYLFPIFD